MSAKVHIVDDDQYARESLEWLVESINIPVVAYSSAQGFLQNTHADQAGCLLLDIRMPEMSGMELFKKIKEKNYSLPVIIMTGHADVTMAVRAMKAGAFDFIEKPYNDSLVLERIQAAIALDEDNKKNREQIKQITRHLQLLTRRENQVLEYVLKSLPNKVIADKLSISIKTVELHRSNLMTKMNVSSAIELVRQVMIVNYQKESLQDVLEMS